MTQEEKIVLLEEILDEKSGTLNPSTALDTLIWDSVAMLSLIALVSSKFNRRLPGADLRKMKTIQDVLNVMEQSPA